MIVLERPTRRRVAGAVGAVLLALAISTGGAAHAEGSSDLTASTGRFTCELPRGGQYTTCQTNVTKPADRSLQVRNVASAGRQVTARTRDANGNTTSGRSMSEGDVRILVNQTNRQQTYSIQARTRFPFVSATRFTGESELVR
jgi:hypothetical protein